MATKSKFPLMLGVEQLISIYGVDCIVFATWTLPPGKAYYDPSEAQKIWNSYRTHLLAKLIVNGVIVIEPRPGDGSVHWHGLLIMPKSVVKLNSLGKRRASDYLKWFWSQEQKEHKKYGMGRTNFQFVKKPRAIGKYITKYVGKTLNADEKARLSEWKGIRRIRWLGLSARRRLLRVDTGATVCEPAARWVCEITCRVADDLLGRSYGYKEFTEDIEFYPYTVTRYIIYTAKRRKVGWRNSSCQYSWVEKGRAIRQGRAALHALGIVERSDCHLPHLTDTARTVFSGTVETIQNNCFTVLSEKSRDWTDPDSKRCHHSIKDGVEVFDYRTLVTCEKVLYSTPQPCLYDIFGCKWGYYTGLVIMSGLPVTQQMEILLRGDKQEIRELADRQDAA